MQNQAAGTSQVRPSPAQPPSVAPQCPGSRSGSLCSTLGPSLPFPPGLENLELSRLLRGASVQKGLPCPRSQPQLELEAAGQAVLDPPALSVLHASFQLPIELVLIYSMKNG